MKFVFWIFKDSEDQSKDFCQNNRTEIRLQIAGSDEDHKTCKPQYYSRVPKSIPENWTKIRFHKIEKAENELHEKEKEKTKTERNGTEEENIQCDQRTADITRMHKYRPIHSLYRAPEPQKWLKRSGKNAGKQRVPPSQPTYSRFREKKLEIGREVCREKEKRDPRPRVESAPSASETLIFFFYPFF